MSTNSSILDDFLIDTTRLSLIRRYKPPFELDKLVLSAEKRQAVLEVMRQQRSAAKDAQANQGASSASDHKMDVEAPDPPKALAESDESKMDVDEPNVSVKEETATGSKNADSGADERSSLSRKCSIFFRFCVFYPRFEYTNRSKLFSFDLSFLLSLHYLRF